MQTAQAIKTIDNDGGNRGSRSTGNSIGNSIVISISIIEDIEHTVNTVRTVAQSGGRAKRGLSGAERNRCRRR